ncbi:alpha/beta hydrolase [Coraliomargarita sp. SDUM461004]|uniref:Alpha/beta hydrolase n=1 Tax=Thalassobacterium sedimentorum TaxID=3041258 RepID=A0ABU1AG08_9BACT|nr:alpha/beta hydrolase [Coraliomargarita sp. SDUM461004]MDQ8193766.1 alpha/beta hydrolase [Coraliomargarita sp. SDUM461004]
MKRTSAYILPILLSIFTIAEANIRLESFDYPFTVNNYLVESQQQSLEMSYMDVAPRGEALATVLLLHGKNFSGAYFEETARALLQEGYRVVMPDQIGFGKSSKPENYQYSFQQLAQNTRQLLESLQIQKVHVLGHSMGGMIASRFALMYPEMTTSLTLLNPIGLEDWKAKGVPYVSVDAWYQSELNKTPEKIRAYQLDSYYDGQWKPAYDAWVELLTLFIQSPQYARMAWNQALTYDMIYTQPVVHEFDQIAVPTLLIIGQRDTTALGKNLVSEEKRATLGNYPQLGRLAHAAIPDSTLVELEGLGHLPQIEAFARFFPPYLEFLKTHNSYSEERAAPASQQTAAH